MGTARTVVREGKQVRRPVVLRATKRKKVAPKHTVESIMRSLGCDRETAKAVLAREMGEAPSHRHGE